jgi:hypothetical protein
MPDSLNVYLHDNYALSNEIDQFSKDYVLDVRFVSNQRLPHVNRDLSREPCRTTQSVPSLTYPRQPTFSHLTHHSHTSNSRHCVRSSLNHWAILHFYGPRHQRKGACTQL